MNLWIKSLIYFGTTFIIVFLIYALFINRKKKEYVEGKKQLEINYLVKKFDLDMRITKYKNIKLIVSLLNSFIIAFTFAIIVNLKVNYVFKLLIAFAILMVLIYSLYEITGRILKSKEKKK